MSEVTNGNEIRESFELEYLQQWMEEVAKNVKLTDPKFRIDMGSNKGDNFIGVIYRVTIEGQKNGKTDKISSIFKCSPQDETQRMMLQVMHLFSREVMFYKEVVPAFSEFLQEHNQTVTDIPICYGASAEDHKEVLILEDLKLKGFVLRDRLLQLDYPHASLAVKHLGRLHALSFALRDQKPDVFRKFSEIKEAFLRTEVLADGTWQHFTKDLPKLVKTALAGEEPHYWKRCETYFENMLEDMGRCCRGDLAEPYAVINHGDFWSNNMMFRYEEGSTNPKDFYFLDFQIARYASPVLDLVYMFFCCCSQELRSNHYDQLIREYHNSLSEHLTELGSDPEKLFPYDALIDQLQKFGKFGAGMALLTIHAFTSKTEDVPEIDESIDHVGQLEKRIQRDHHYRNTLRDSFKDLVDRNYI